MTFTAGTSDGSLLFFCDILSLHMEQEIITRLQAQEELLQKVYISTEKTRKYFLWTMWGTVILFVLPLVGLVFAIPAFLSSYSSMLSL